MKNGLKLAALILLVAALTSCDSSKEKKRPRDPWVFRSVLDKKPRMVTAVLHDDLYVAYDAQRCKLYKAWKGGVIFDGAVYTTNHGPQPTSKGYAYYTDTSDKSGWVLVNDAGKEQAVKIAFKGYATKNGEVTFHFELQTDDGKIITL